MTPLIGFAPDVDATAPGVITDCSNLIPFEGGFRGAPAPTSVGANALAAACRGIASVTNLAGSRRVIAGTGTKLYELGTTAWTDVSRGANYTLGTDDRFSFIQYADATLIATPGAPLQRSVSGAFADIAGAPTAKLIESAQGFAVAFNTSSFADEWYCSEYLNDAGWTLSVSTQCVKGRLIGGSGPITAARRFGDNIIAYKGGTVFSGTYVGAPEVWRWTQVASDIGCVGQDAVVDTTVGHVFVGKDNVYIYDGTTPRPIATGTIRKWLFDDMAGASQFKTTLLWDRPRHLVWIYYASAGGSGAVNRCAVYHVLTQKWGLAHSTIEAVVNYTSPTFTYDGGSVLVTTYDASPSISYDSLSWVAGASSVAVVNSSHQIAALSGACVSSSFTTGDVGDDEGYRTCTNLRVRYLSKPTTSIATGYTKDAEGDLTATGSNASIGDGRHNMRQTARFHRFKVDTTGDYTVTAFRPEWVERGKR
ncbi:MAG: hypothetical protein Q7T97_02495 [Burkholderiaceae bacterium]|nr:hypothetical protein [Burkholderiaceae bacterium]